MKCKDLLLIPILALFSVLVRGQITGTVTDQADGMPIPGASVLVSGTSQGTATDFDGNYTLKNADADAILVFSYVGYKTQEIQVNGRSVINVVLVVDAAELEQVIVTGYSRERKVDVTGAITVVELGPSEAVSMSSGSTVQGLQGRVSGLFIQKSGGDPTGINNNVLIRGATTLGDNNPLYVIDGVPTVRQEIFAGLNPSTIESIQVLKDASASSLYGARAGNGVIIVTTKNRAKSGGEKITVSINSNVSVLSEKKQRYDMLNAQERGQVLWQASVNDGADPNGGYGEIYDFDWNNDFDNPILNSVTVQPFVGGDTSVPVGDTDWQDELYQTGYVYNNEISVSGGTDNSFHLLNIGHLRNTGILKFTGYERISAKLNSNFNLLDNKIRIGINTQFTTSDETLASQDVGSALTPGLGISLAPTLPVYDVNGNYAGPLGAGYSDRNNPLLIQDINQDDNTDRTNVFGNIYAEFDILKNLTFRTSLGLDYGDFKKRDIERRVFNGFITRADNRLIESSNKFTSVVFSNTLDYQLELGDDHKIGVLLGTEAIKNDFASVTATANTFAVETASFFQLNAATGARTNTGSSTGSRLLSQFGKVNYAFQDRYLASFTLRRDGSSRFGAENRYGVFPAASIGWRISNEKFWKENDVVNTLKFRAGYGEVGNQTIGDVSRFGLFETRYGPNEVQFTDGFFEIYYNVGTAYDLNGNNGGTLPSGFVSIQAANPALKWETTKEINVGVDFTLFKNNITGSFDYFTRETSDILTTPPIASVIGEGQLRVLNGATTETKGWELSLGYSKNLSDDLRLAITTNFGAFKDEITALPAEVVSSYPGTTSNSIIGHSQFSIFGYKTAGLFQSQSDIDSSPSQVGARPGSLKFQDLNGDGVIDGNDRDFIGTTLPDLEYGIRIDLNYKNFDLSVFGSGVTGRIGQDPYIFWNNFVQGRENGGLGLLDAWTTTNTGSSIPSLSLAFNDQRTSDYLFRNNSYFKLRNLQFGYTLSENITKTIGMTDLRIYFQGENLFWITPKDYIGADPERADVNNIPVPTTLSLGLNMNF